MRILVYGLAVTLFFFPVDSGQAQLKKLKTGVVAGEVRAIQTARNKRDMELELLAPGEEKARKYTVGAHQKVLLETLKFLQVGDRVEIDWFDTVEGLCVEKLRLLKKTPGK
jgi:hypothetical protein